MSAVKETEWARRERRNQERAEYVAAHGNVCELCGNAPKSRGLNEDHDHRTGLHRGWLCHRCNRGLPTWVTPEWLLKAAVYLGATWQDCDDSIIEGLHRVPFNGKEPEQNG